MIKALGSVLLLGATATDVNASDVIGQIYERPMAGLLVATEQDDCGYQVDDEDAEFWENLILDPVHRESLLHELGHQNNMSTGELNELLNLNATTFLRNPIFIHGMSWHHPHHHHHPPPPHPV